MDVRLPVVFYLPSALEFGCECHGSRNTSISAHALVTVAKIILTTIMTRPLDVAVGVAIRALEAHAHAERSRHNDAHDDRVVVDTC